MNKDDKLNTISSSYGNKNIMKKELNKNVQGKHKILTPTRTLKNTRTLKGFYEPNTKEVNKSKNEINENTRKEKLDNHIKADGKFDAFFNNFDKEDKDSVNKNKNNTNGNRKLRDKRDVSCTCNII